MTKTIPYTVDSAIQVALSTAEEKQSDGLLFKASDDFDEDATDFETVYSIISLYQDDENNDGTWEDKITKALQKEYSEYF